LSDREASRARLALAWTPGPNAIHIILRLALHPYEAIMIVRQGQRRVRAPYDPVATNVQIDGCTYVVLTLAVVALRGTKQRQNSVRTDSV
jgi:hypothetical protein